MGRSDRRPYVSDRPRALNPSPGEVVAAVQSRLRNSSRPHRHRHPRLRGRQPGGVVRGQLPGLRGRQEAPPRCRRRPTPPHQVQAAGARVRRRAGIAHARHTRSYTGKVGHDVLQSACSLFVLASQTEPVTTFRSPGPKGISLRGYMPAPDRAARRASAAATQSYSARPPHRRGMPVPPIRLARPTRRRRYAQASFRTDHERTCAGRRELSSHRVVVLHAREGSRNACRPVFNGEAAT